MSFRKSCGVAVSFALWLAVAQSAFAVTQATVTMVRTQFDDTTTMFDVDIPLPDTSTVVVGTDTFTRLTVPGAHPALLDTGKPEVPNVAVVLATPDGSCPPTWTVVERVDTVLNIPKVYPLQPFRSDGDSGGFVFDTAFYSSSTNYPDSDVAIISLGH